MSAAAAIAAPKLEPLIRTRFGLAEHNFRRFNAIVPADTMKEDLENPRFWENVQSLVNTFDEIRAVSEDGSFYAVLFVAAKAGNQIYPRVVFGTDVGEVDTTELTARQSRYTIKLKGPLKWCIVDTQTGENVQQGIPRQSDALRQLEEHLQALSL